MSATVDTAQFAAAKVPATLSAAAAWDEICRGMGISIVTAEEAANLPPWTEEEAAAFERAINESGEQIDNTPEIP